MADRLLMTSFVLGAPGSRHSFGDEGGARWKPRRFELHCLDHVDAARAAPVGSSPPMPAEAGRQLAGTNCGATTACPREVTLKRISFTGW